MDPTLRVVLIVVGSLIAYSVMGGFITGIWVEMWPPDRYDRNEVLTFNGMCWPISIVIMMTIAAHHIGRAAVRHCASFIRL
jgi:hypothetical protein